MQILLFDSHCALTLHVVLSHELYEELRNLTASSTLALLALTIYVSDLLLRPAERSSVFASFSFGCDDAGAVFLFFAL